MENLHLVSLEVYILVFVVGSLLAADLEVSRGTRSVLNRTAPWDCFEMQSLVICRFIWELKQRRRRRQRERQKAIGLD